MKRRRRSRSVLAVSLFPFLAVLICTLGVLIVLLVLAVKQADVEATARQASADDVQKAELAVVQNRLEARQVQIEGLQMVRPEALERLATARSTRSHYESETRRLKEETRSILGELDRLTQQQAGLELDDVSDEQLDSLKKQIELAKSKRDVARAEAAKPGEVSWSIVPYRGVNGTDRRPIFIECTADEIIIQPLGITLPRHEFKYASLPNNPIDAAVLAIREYWQRYDLDGASANAYPLLIVREEGSQSFETAKRSLHGWDDEFGYELVGADKKLDFGPYDAELAKEVKAAVAAARVRHQRLVAVAQQRQERARWVRQQSSPKSDRRPGLTVSKTGGGFVRSGVAQASGFESNGGGDSYRTRNAGGTLERESTVASTYSRPSPAAANAPQLQGSRGTEARGTQSAQTSQVSTQAGTANAQAGAPGGAEAAGAMSGPTDGTEANRSAVQANAADSSQSSPAQSLAEQRGQNWGLPSRAPGAVAHVRPIRVICLPDRLVVRGLRGDQSVPLNESVRLAVDPLVDIIWKQIESWGVAGANAYWKPQLRMTVAPGAQATVRELQQLMANSGILLQATEATQ